MSIGLVQQSAEKLKAAEKQLSEAQDRRGEARATLRDLKSRDASPEREIALIAQLAYIETLTTEIVRQDQLLREVQAEHANVLARRKKQGANLEHHQRELARVKKHDQKTLKTLQVAIQALIDGAAKGTRYAKSFDAVLEAIDNELRAVGYAEMQIENAQAGLLLYDGAPAAIEPAPAPSQAASMVR
jgi:chromosome segregation ATPase